MSTTPLRPRSATEIVDASFRLLRQCYLQLAAVAVVMLLPYIILLLVAGVNLRNPFEILPLTLVQLLCAALAEAAVIVAASESYLDGTTHVGAALATTGRRLPAIIGALFARWGLVGVTMMAVILLPAILLTIVFKDNPVTIVGVMFVLVMAPFVYMVLRTMVVAPALMLEGKGPIGAVARSWHLAGGQMGRIFVTMLLAWLIYFAIFFVLSFAVNLGMTINPTVASVLSAVLIAFAYPFIGVVTTLLYYDLRVRKEGLDLEMQLASVPSSEF